MLQRRHTTGGSRVWAASNGIRFTHTTIPISSSPTMAACTSPRPQRTMWRTTTARWAHCYSKEDRHNYIGFEICSVFVIAKRTKIMTMGLKFVYVFSCRVFCVARWRLMSMTTRMQLVLPRHRVESVKGSLWKSSTKVTRYFTISIFRIITAKILICFNHLLESKVF